MSDESHERLSSASGEGEPIGSQGPEHEYRFRSGERIADRYEVIEPLGFGGFAESITAVTLGWSGM